MTRKRTFADFDIGFAKHPATGDVVVKRDKDAVKQAVLNLVQLNFYEKPFHPEIGSNLRGLLFENATQFTAKKIEDSIRKTIERFEPRAKVEKLEVYPGENEYTVYLEFSMPTFVETVEVKFILRRLR